MFLYIASTMVVETTACDSQQQQSPKTKEQPNVQCGTTGHDDLSRSDSSVIAHGAAYKDGRSNHRWPSAPKSSRCSSQWAGHMGHRPLARGPCHRVRYPERANQCAATAAAMQPVRGGHWTIKLPSSDFLLAAAGGAAPTRPAAVAAVSAKVAGAKTAAAAAAVTVTIESPPPPPPPQTSQPQQPPAHHHRQQWPVQNYMQLVCRDKRAAASQPPQQLQPRHKQSSTRLADVVAAGAFYTATSYWPQQQQPEDSYLLYRTADQRVYQQVAPYASWRDMRPKIGCVPIRQTTCADGDRHHEPSDHHDGGYTHQDQLQSFLTYQHQEPHPAQNWDQESYLPYQDAVPGINGQGDGDAPAYGGGALAVAGVDDADVLRDEQDEVVALLAEIDERHEKHLAFERVLQEQEPNFWRHRWRAQAQFPSQHLLLPQQVINVAGSSDSVEVFVDGGVWRSVSDNGLFDRSDRRLCPPLRVIQPRASSVFFQRFIADDITISRATRTTGSPTAPPSRAKSPSHDPVVAVATSAAPEKDSLEPTTTAADVSAPSEDGKQNGVEQKFGEEAGGSKEGKASPFVVPRLPYVQAKEAACAMPVTRNQPPHAQRQEPADAIHQQRKTPNDYRRSTYPRREYHSTRRYSEHDHSTPPPSSVDRAPVPGRQFKTNDGGRYQPNGQCRDASNNRPPANHNHHHHHFDGGGVYAKGQQQSGRGGCHSANRNRNRQNNNNNNRQCNGANQWNKDRVRQEVCPDVGNRGGFVGHGSSLPYCCRSVGGGGSRVSSPANASAAATPPPSHRGRRYNNKQGAGGGCGHQQQAQRQYSTTRPTPQQVSPTSRDMQTTRGRSAVDNNGARHQPNRKANGDASSRKPRRQQQPHQQQRADYNHPRCTSSRASEPTPATSPAQVSRSSCESAPPGCDSGDAAPADCADGDLSGDGLDRASSMSLRMFWERTNLTIFRRRSSQ